MFASGKLLSQSRIKEYFLFIGFAFISYLTLFILSVIYYPDGVVPSGIDFGQYQFWKHFISDLGMVSTFGGLSNTLSRTLLLFSFSILAIFLSAFYIMCYQYLGGIQQLLKPHSKGNKLLKASIIIGIFANFPLIFVVIFPKDTMLTAHAIVTLIFFISMLISLSMIYGILLSPKLNGSKKNHKFLISMYLFWTAFAVYSFVPLIFPELQAEDNYFKPTMQKITVLTMLLAVLNLNLMFIPILKKNNEKFHELGSN